MTLKPLEYCLIAITKEYEDEIVLAGGNLRLFIDTSFAKNQHCTCVGSIAALPTSPKTNLEKRICKHLRVNDEVAFSYRVVSDIDHILSPNIFTEYTPKESIYIKRFTNSKQEWITKARTPTTTGGFQWNAVYTSQKGDVKDGITDRNEEVINSWLQKFNFEQPDKFKFNNLVGIGDFDYWKVSLDEIFAVRRDGKLTPVGDRLLLKPYDRDVTKLMEIKHGAIIKPGSTLSIRAEGCGKALHNYPALGIEKGDCIGFEQRYIETYNFFGKDYLLLKPHRALMISSEEPKLNAA